MTETPDTCPTCHGSGRVAVGPPDFYGNVDTDECVCQLQTPRCGECGDTGLVPPFMDPCDCGAAPITPGFDPNGWGIPAPGFDPDGLGLRAKIPGTDITTPGFPLDPMDGLVWQRSTDGAHYVYDRESDMWLPISTEALTPAEYHAKYDAPVEYEGVGEIDDDAIEFEADAAAIAAALAAEAEEVEAVIDAIEYVTTLDEMDTPEAVAAIDDDAVAEWGASTWTATAEATVTAHETDAAGWVTGVTEVPVVTSAATYKAASAASAKPISPAQTTLLARLIAERNPSLTLVTQAATELAAGDMTAKRASRTIDALMKIPADPTRKAIKPNKYSGACVKCKGDVEAGEGRVDQIDGRWKTSHLDGKCHTATAVAAAAVDRVDEPGLYRLTDGEGTVTIYRVRPGRSSKRLYGERVITHTHTHADGTKHTTVEFIYNANAMRILTKSSKLTWQEARDFGAAYGACVACGRTLSDPRSLVQNYGPTCAGHYGWPTVTAKQAEAIIAGVLSWEDVVGTGSPLTTT